MIDCFTSKYELLKLDRADLQLASWMYRKHPKALYSFLEFINKTEYSKKGIQLNIEKLYKELIKSMT